MYLSIIILPLISGIVSGLLGRKIGVKGSHWISGIALISAALLSCLVFYETGIGGSPVKLKLMNWIDSEILEINWGIYMDSLTVSMALLVTIVSACVHIYAIGYMEGDPHNQRFFSYLSLFTFFMLILICADNFLVLFIGWEGSLKCLKWFNNYDNILLMNFISFNKPNYNHYDSNKKYFFTYSNQKIFSSHRIGPHNEDIISIIIGSLLGDSHLEKRKNSKGTRIIFEQSNKNVQYLNWFHSYLAERGYCNSDLPKLHTRIKKEGVFFHYRVNSYTFSSLNWIHEKFYKKNSNNKLIKIIPKEINKFLSPLALAIWFMDDGSKSKNSARIATNNFTLEEIKYLCFVLYEKYNIIATPQKSGKNKGYILYISTNSMENFSKLIKSYMIPSMYYKLGNY